LPGAQGSASFTGESCRSSFLILFKTSLHFAELINARIVTRLLQATERHLGAGAAEGGYCLVELAIQRQALRPGRELLIAQPLRSGGLRQ